MEGILKPWVLFLLALLPEQSIFAHYNITLSSVTYTYRWVIGKQVSQDLIVEFTECIVVVTIRTFLCGSSPIRQHIGCV